MASITMRVIVLIRDAGECPMCGFDSLRRVTGNHLTPSGVTTMFEQVFCGRCINDIRDSVDARDE